MKLLALLFALSCASAPLVPLVPRPDTRRIGVLQMDSAVIRGSLEIFAAAMPAEAAVCYTGEIRDTVQGMTPILLLHLTHVTQAIADSASEFYVFFPAQPRTGCVNPLAAGHSHPYNGVVCAHSDLDANVLFTDPRLLASVVWCGDGRLEVMYQDGRRYAHRWR